MPLTWDTEVWQRRLAALPLASYGAGEPVFSEGTKTGRLLILKTGRVRILKDGIEIAQVTEPGVVFGEISGYLIKRIQRTWLPWSRRSFTSPTLPHFLCKTPPRFFTLPQT